MNAILTTAVILIAAVVLSFGVVLYGTELFSNVKIIDQNYTETQISQKYGINNNTVSIYKMSVGNSTHYFLMQEKKEQVVFYVTANDNWTQVEKACEINQWCYFKNNNTLHIMNSSIIVTGVKK